MIDAFIDEVNNQKAAMQPKMTDGQKELHDYKISGFTDDELNQYKSEKTQEYLDSGFTNEEIKDYWGDVKPDMSALKSHVETNLSEATKPSGEGDAPREAMGFKDALIAGFQGSATGLMFRQEKPDVVLPENSTTAMKIGSMIGGLADLPEMAIGGTIGGVVGGTAGFLSGGPVGLGVGLLAGEGAGAFALPAAMRKIMMDHYEKGDINSASEFFERAASTAWETIKQGAVGAATLGLGKGVGAGLAAKGVGFGVAKTAATATEIATMTTMGAAVEGHLPEPDDFLAGAVLIGGIHAVGIGGKNLRKIYSERGIKPQEIVKAAEIDPHLKQQIVSTPKVELEGPKETIKVEQKNFNQVGGEPGKMSVDIPQDIVKMEPVKKGEPKLFNKDIERRQDELDMLGHIGEAPVTKNTITIEKLVTGMLDDLHPLKVVTKELATGVGDGANPYILGRLYRGVHGMISAAIKHGTYDFSTKKIKTGEGLVDILKDIPKVKKEGMLLDRNVTDVDGFKANVVARRVVELYDRGIKTGLEDKIESARKNVAIGKHFNDTHKRLVAYQNRMMDYAVEAGLLSAESAAKIKAVSKDYVPFHRIFEADPLTGTTKISNSFKTMKGSESQILDPIDTVYKNTAAIIRAAEKNRVLTSLVEMTQKVTEVTVEGKEIRAGEDFVRKAKRPVKKIELSEKEVAKILDQHGVDPDITAEVANIFRPVDQQIKDNQFMIKRNGKTEIYETTPGISDAINALDVSSGLPKNWLTTFMTGFAKTLRFGVTATPDFFLRNIFRDQLTSGVQSKYAQIPFYDALHSVGKMTGNSKAWEEYLRSGAASGGFGEALSYIEKDVWKLNEQTGFIGSVHNVVKNPIHAINIIAELAEQTPRFTEFRKGGGTVTAAMSARDVTVDFSRGGTKIRALNALVPFMNVGVQGLYKTGESFKERPFETFAKATAMITMPSVLLWYANKDDSRYKNAPNWQKDLFWIIPTDKWEKATSQADVTNREKDLVRQAPDGTWEVNNGTVYRVPKPFEFGVLFGTLPERALNVLYSKDPDALKGFGETVFQAVTPNVIPTIALPYLEQRFNESFFTNRPLVPYHLEKVLPDLQYAEYTSEVAKNLGKIIGKIPFVRDIGPDEAKLASPMVIDNYIRDWTGTLGQYALDLADSALTATQRKESRIEKPLDTTADIPFVKAFVMRNPSNQMQPIKDLYDNHAESSKIRASFKLLMKQGKVDEARLLAKENPIGLINLDKYKKAISEQNKAIHMIYISNKFNREEKRQMIDTLYYGISKIAAQGNMIVQKSIEKK